MYITNDEELAVEAEKAGVDWIFVDLEINGKEERQGHLDTVISRHTVEDVVEIKAVLKQAELLVRVNPMYEGSKQEIKQVIKNGADIVMLPFFKQAKEVREFIQIVDGQAKTCLLLETKEAVSNLDEILLIDGIDYIHIGLNDLHLSYNLTFMFELFSNGTIEFVSSKIKRKNIKYGVGGIARLGMGELSSKYILAEHLRLGSSMAILSRSFHQSHDQSMEFSYEIKKIRRYIESLDSMNSQFFEKNKKIMDDKIDEIVASLRSD